MFRRILYILIVVIVGACKTQKPPTPTPTPNPDPNPDPNTELTELLHFPFDENNGNTFLDLIGAKSLNASDKFNGPERIKGVKGLALRTNGYYGWAEGTIGLSMPQNSITVSGWVSLASYPIHRKNQDSIEDDTVGALFSNYNIAYTNGIALGINQHGRIVTNYDANGVSIRMRSSEVVPLYSWNHLTFTVNAETGDSRLYLNGQMIKNTTLTKGGLGLNSNYTAYLGKGSKNKFIGSVVTNGLNGAIDEVKIWSKAMTDVEVNSEFQSYSNITEPDLSIPESRFEDDYYRPQYHLSPSAGWTNESHGLFYKDNTYHIFSQRNLNAVLLEHINWGHYTSNDLLHWTEQKQALWPEPGFDEVGIWSGHALVKNNIPYLFYTGVNKAKAAIGIATPVDNDLISWKKSSANPVIDGAPNTISNKDFRDPFVFEYQNEYFMIIGTGLNNSSERGGLFLYKSSNENFTKWDYRGVFAEGNPGLDGTGVFWEMPIYVDFGTKQVLLINKLPNAASLYWSGNFNGSNFVKDNDVPKKLEAINHLLSPTISKDKDGNTVAIGIIPDLIGGSTHANQGWGHTFSLPRIWTFENNEIYQKPHTDIKSLRSNERLFSNITFGPTSDFSLGTTKGRFIEIEAMINPADADRVGFELYVSGSEKMPIIL
jgi:beta-fructofuranosidase